VVNCVVKLFWNQLGPSSRMILFGSSGISPSHLTLRLFVGKTMSPLYILIITARHQSIPSVHPTLHYDFLLGNNVTPFILIITTRLNWQYVIGCNSENILVMLVSSNKSDLFSWKTTYSIYLLLLSIPLNNVICQLVNFWTITNFFKVDLF